MQKQAVKTSKSRNSEVDFWRLVFAIVVVIHHSHGLRPPDPQRYAFVGGYLAVEFFLILSGYFAVLKAQSEKLKGKEDPNALRWTIQKFSKICVYVVPAIALHYLAHILINKLSFREAIKCLVYGLFEMLFLPATGIFEIFLDAPIWYLSAMLVILPVFFLMLIKLRNNTVDVVCYFSSLLIYGYYSRTEAHIGPWGTWTGLFYISLIRVWAGLCIGYAVFHMAKWLCSLSLTPWGKKFLTAVELISGGIVFFYMFTRTQRRLDFLCIGLLMTFASIIMSEKSSIHQYFASYWSRFSTFSLVLYASHWTIRMLIPALMPLATYDLMFLPYIVTSCLYAGLLILLVNMLKAYIPWDRLKRKIVSF